MTTTQSRPVPLGSAFNRLFTAAAASNLADGIARLAIPLAAVTLTTDPVIISAFTALSFVPAIIFGVPAGIITDRMDRRHAMALANALRVIAAVGVTLVIAAGALNLWVLAAALIVFGLGETLFDNATNAVVPSIVPREGLDRANSRVQAAQLGLDMFVATPISSVLFAIAVALPMIVGGAGYLVAGALVLALPIAAAHGVSSGKKVAEERAQISMADAARYLWNHRFLRGMTVMTSLAGALFSLAQATTILLLVDFYAVPTQWLGLVTAGIGAGGLAGALTAPVLVSRFGRGRAMVVFFLIGSAGLLVVGLVPNLWVSMGAYAIGAYGVASWNVPWGSLRQDLVPAEIRGRVFGVMRTIGWGLVPAATLLGGWIATFSLMAPFVVGGGLTVVIALASVRLILRADEQVVQAVAAESAEASEESDPVAAVASPAGLEPVPSLD